MSMSRVVLAAVALAAIAAPAVAELKTPRPSPNAVLKQTIGLTDVTVTYSRPGVKGRAIWGDLVPYGEPWRTGANEATTIQFSDDVTVNGKPLKAGTYGFLTIPGQESWTAAFNTKSDLWGANGYDKANDALRLEIKPGTGTHQEWMRFSFENLSTDNGDLVLAWEQLTLTMTIGTNSTAKTVAAAKTEVAVAKADDATTRFRAASFLLDVNQELPLATTWAEESVKIKPGYLNQQVLAKLYAKQGKKKEATATMEKAIAAGKTGENPFDTRPSEKLLAEWKD